MQQIWVSGNPFTRTHATTYRVSIFNFFRAASGFNDDVMIDGSLPGIVERRNLVDRVFEKPPPLPASQRLQSPPPLHTHTRMESPAASDARKKKSNRMRIVSLENRAPANAQDIQKHDPKTPGAHGDVGGEEYRRRLEALREEAGAGWLRVLSESGGLTENGVKNRAGGA
jgi:hypothetical protein